MSLKNKVCIITGGNSGIGRATALKFARDRARIAIVGRSQATLEDTAGEIKAVGADVLTFAMDVADPAAAQAVVRSVRDRHGQVDVLVNSAGGGSLHKLTLTTTPEDMQRVIGTNLLGTIYFAQAVLPAMLKAKNGVIVNVSSGAARNPGALGGMIYGAAKAGVNNVTAFINAEYRNSGVRACVVISGEVDTPALTRNRPVPPSESARATMLTADDVADAIYLMANAAPRAHIQELVIRPTMYRDTSAETPRA